MDNGFYCFLTGNLFIIQMLANMDNSVMFHTTGLADDSTLCAKKDIIIAKFDALLKKLGGEDLLPPLFMKEENY